MNARTLRSLPLLVVLVTVGFPTPTTHAQCPSQVWADEFSGTSLDTTKWSYQVGDGCQEGVCGWGNNELQSYQRDNVTVGDGVLTIEAREQRVRGKQYTSGRIRTLNQGDWPFDEPFHFLLNVAVGGNWPGNPDATTVFPQRMEVDWVRVSHDRRPA